MSRLMVWSKKQMFWRVARSVRHGLRQAECFWALGWAICLSVLLGFDRVSDYLMSLSKHQVQYLLKHFGAQIGRGCDIESQIVIHHAEGNYHNLRIGNDCHIGKQVFLDLASPIEIGDQVTISMRTMILTHRDVGQSPLGKTIYPVMNSPVKIEHGAYIGAGAIILPGVRIGKCALVGAGAVVTKDVEPKVVVVGVPAMTLKRLEMSLEG